MAYTALAFHSLLSFKDGAIRVNLDHRETFSEFLLSLWKSILLARKHGHFPFPAIAEEVCA